MQLRAFRRSLREAIAALGDPSKHSPIESQAGVTDDQAKAARQVNKIASSFTTGRSRQLPLPSWKELPPCF